MAQASWARRVHLIYERGFTVNRFLSAPFQLTNAHAAHQHKAPVTKQRPIQSPIRSACPCRSERWSPLTKRRLQLAMTAIAALFPAASQIKCKGGGCGIHGGASHQSKP